MLPLTEEKHGAKTRFDYREFKFPAVAVLLLAAVAALSADSEFTNVALP